MTKIGVDSAMRKTGCFRLVVFEINRTCWLIFQMESRALGGAKVRSEVASLRGSENATNIQNKSSKVGEIFMFARFEVMKSREYLQICF